jgi:hypothetical protein
VREIHCGLFNALQAERDFNLKNVFETSNRKLAARDYVSSTMSVTCNKPYLLRLITGSPIHRVDQFSALLARAAVSGRGMKRIPGRAARKNRRRLDAPSTAGVPARGFIDLSDDEDDADAASECSAGSESDGLNSGSESGSTDDSSDL